MDGTRMVVDSGIFIEFLRASNKEKTTLFKMQKSYDFAVSAVTLYELLMGAKDLQKQRDLGLLVNSLPILPFDKLVSEKAGNIYHDLRKRNQMIEFRDIFIGATAMVYDLPILTFNKKHFSRIDGLEIFDSK